MLKIGSLKVDPPLILAPLAGISDLPYRKLMRKFGASLAFIEMINVRALSYNSKKSSQLLTSDAKDRPLGIQLLGSEEKFILRALDIIHSLKVDIIDFNAACPVKKVVRRQEGAALLQEPKRLNKLLKLIRKNTSLPLSVKIRTGWSKDSINAKAIALACQDAGADCLFIHGRTRNQKYGGRVDYKAINDVKKSLTIPVVGSGNILSASLAKKMLDETGVDGLLLARGSLGNPWIIKEIKTFLDKGKILEKPPLKQRIAVMLEHLDNLIDFYAEKKALLLFRKFIGWYLKGAKNIRLIKRQINTIKKRQDLVNLLSQYSAENT